MKNARRMIVFMLVALLLVLAASALYARPNYCSMFTGTVVGFQGGIQKWLDVRSDVNWGYSNFRVGWRTTYVPNRYTFTGERVRVEYCPDRGVDVAYSVTVIGRPR